MPWSTPPLRSVREFVRDNVRAYLPGADALVPNSVLRVLSDVQGALCSLNLQYLDWLARQLIPDTAETEWLDRHGFIWLVNADGSTGRKLATLASGTVDMMGYTPWAIVPQGTRMSYGGITYETIEATHIAAPNTPTPVRIRALDPGSMGNVPHGASLTIAAALPNISLTAIAVNVSGGVDEETDDELRHRVLERIRFPPQGGAWHDYVNWALAVPGVTRAWCNPLEMGMGTATVRFMCDSLRADNDGFPLHEDVETVRAYLDTVRPVAVKDIFVVAPIKRPVNFSTRNLQVNTEGVRAAIEASLRKMLREKAAPGQTIYAVWKSQAAMEAPGVVSFDMIDCDRDDVMESPGHMSVLGNTVFT